MTPIQQSSEPFQLDFRPRRRTTDQEELAFYRAAHRATPDVESIRFSLARLLNALGHFEEAAGFLKTWASEDSSFLQLKIRANLGLDTAESVDDARLLCEQMLERCDIDFERGAVHYLLADCLLRQHKLAAARAELIAGTKR